ncbi:MAG: NAD(+)/NADH kinase [Clostridiales bacterium]|nr:NAD(+)/NADH kinase [Clostridiales bacterium]
MNILLFPHSERDINLRATNRVADMVRKTGGNPVIIQLSSVSGTDIPFPTAEELNSDFSIIIAFGGDGTILRAARQTFGSGVPIIGVNLGGMGFLTEIEVDEIEEVIPDVLAGYYTVQNRMMLDVELVRGDELLLCDSAVNDVIIRGQGKTIELAVSGDGNRIMAYVGDGIIVATPTGSTGYSMSAGGPIVEPSAKNILVTPVSAHLLMTKPFVLDSDRVVTVEILPEKPNPAYISVDGNEHTRIYSGDLITIKESDMEVRFAHITGRNFYKRVSDKLGNY